MHACKRKRESSVLQLLDCEFRKLLLLLLPNYLVCLYSVARMLCIEDKSKKYGNARPNIPLF